jgi:uncharacterized protein
LAGKGACLDNHFFFNIGNIVYEAIMTTYWVTLTNLPANGREFTFKDQGLWSEPLQEFALPWQIASPLQATVFLLPQKNDCYIQGWLTGGLELACHRCAEPTLISIDRHFEVFESLPEDPTDPLAPNFLRQRDGLLELDMAGILWEELQLALPDKVLCSEQCQGLCPHCGANLNQDPCDCAKETVDPRLAVFRQLKIN